MDLPELKIPVCPSCKTDQMHHLCVSHVPGCAGFRKNGWYCQLCETGPYQLGNVSEKDAALTAAFLYVATSNPLLNNLMRNR